MLGTGTELDPYIISTPADLDAVRNNLSAYYDLANDIDMVSWGNFTPIGKASPYFIGYFNGKGFKINNLTVDETTNYSGLFGVVTGDGVLQNLGMENASISGTNYNGVIVGYISTSTTIDNCFSTGQINGTSASGGIVGNMQGGNVLNCFSHASVTNSSYGAGGLVGDSSGTPTITNCFSTGLVVAASLEGGLIGRFDNGSVTSSYWDTDTSGQIISAGGTGKTTLEMQEQATYINWDFTNIWGMNGYPYLRVFGELSAPPKVETINVNSYVIGSHSNASKLIKSVKQVVSYTSPIESNVTTSTKSVKSATETVTSFINPIYTYVESKSKKFINLLSYVKKLNSSTTTDKFADAHVSFIVNPSKLLTSVNLTNIYHNENPSLTEVVE